MCKEKFDLEKEISTEVENFKNIIKGDFNKYIDKNFNKMEGLEQKKIVTEALYAGYLDTCRTVKWKDKTENDRKPIVEQIFKDSDVVDQITKFMKNGVLGKTDKERQDNFDAIHFELCTAMKEEFEKKCITFTYGQTQKIINMAFKYLYCIDGIDKECFRSCHMPLDSFTLEWIYKACLEDPEKMQGIKIGKGISVREQGKFVKKEAIGTWSSMLYENTSPNTEDKCTYKFYLNLLRKNFSNECLLKMDFYIWPRMQKILAAEEFIKAFNDGGNKKFTNLKDEDNSYHAYQLANLETTLQKKLQSVINIIYAKK